eukprot:6233845-Ditylum_brightwellii.AAC.1
MKQNEPQDLEAPIERNHKEDENKQCERHEHKRAHGKHIFKGDEKEREKACEKQSKKYQRQEPEQESEEPEPESK